MKNKSILWIATIVAAISACTDDKTELGVPVQTGDEILFGTYQSGNGVGSRTSYGDEYTEDGKQYVKVNWVQDDQIAVYCSQAAQPASHRVDYKITPGKNPSTSSAVIKMSDVGLQWGQTDLHEFYGFYPANRLEKVDEGKLYASIPVDQQPVKWTYDEKNKTWIGEPNMEYAYMYAYNPVKKSEMTQGKDVPLQFHPLVTVLEVTVTGSSVNEMTVSNVNINAVEGTNLVLTGQFYCDLTPEASSSGSLGNCHPSGGMGETRNRVSISCYNSDTKNFITLKAGEKLKVKAFFIPNDDQTIHPRQLQVSVSPLNGANLVKNLKTADVLPHKINRVILPPLTTPGVNYWMSSLDPNIYLTELSIPGSEMSMLSAENGSGIEYQHVSVSDQFDLGIRAFTCQTGASYTHYGLGDWDTEYTPEELYVAIGQNRSSKTVKTFLTELSQKITEAQNQKKFNEFVIANLTFSRGATYADGDWTTSGDREYAWMTTVDHFLKQYKDDPNIFIYGTNTDEKITAESTINDGKGKIIVKVNVNNVDMGNSLGSTDVPAIYALWSGPYVDNGVPLYWGTSKNLNQPSGMTWFYQEHTNVEADGSQGTLTQKTENIQKLFDKSLEYYKDGTHNTWFMNDLGGFYKSESTQGVKDLAAILNSEFFDKIQTRNDNAGLGLIYMNFADSLTGYGKDLKSPELIQTIIDNNFKFQLRKKGSTTTSYDANYTNGGNAIGWDN